MAARVNVPVVMFTLAVVFAWGVLLSLAPLSEVWRVRLAHAIRADAARAGSAGHGVRTLLISSQIALSVILVIGGLLLVRTFLNVQRIDPGFNAEGLFSFRINTRPAKDYGLAVHRQLQAALSAVPGVEGAASISHTPYDHVPNWGGPYLSVAGADPSTAPQADYRSLSPGALELLGIRVIEGRSFTEDDDITTDAVVIVDERLAARTWPNESALGKRLGVDTFVTGKPGIWATVIGVVTHVRHRNPVAEVREQIFFPQRQVFRNPSVYIVKTTGDPAAIAASVREAVKAVDPALPIYDARPLSVYVEDANATRAFTMQLAVIFALVALTLASVGIYGVVAYSVHLRHREFGVRRALGARAVTVAGLVARDAAVLLTRGVVAGLAGAALTGWFLRGLLYGVSPWDMTAYATAIPVLLAAGVVACILPTRRAITSNPVDALRAE